MRPTWIARVLIVLALALGVGSLGSRSALATPDDRAVTYSIFFDPAHPEEGVRFTISLDLNYLTTEEDFNVWEVTAISITKFDEEQEIVGRWAELNPDVQTGDGLWWTEHANTEEPVAEDFTMPPRIEGIAPQQNQATNMEYVIEGTTCSGNCQTQAISVPSVMILFLRIYVETYPPEPPGEPEIDEEEEPADTEDDVPP